LIDVTEDRELWRTDVVYDPERPQIVEIPAYSGEQGFRIYPDHEYEVETIYSNSTDAAVDAMSVMYLYYHPDGDVDVTYPDPPPAMQHEGHH